MSTKNVNESQALAEHFAGPVRFDSVIEDGPLCLWKSTETRSMDDGAALEVVKFHITDNGLPKCLFMVREKAAFAQFNALRPMATITNGV